MPRAKIIEPDEAALRFANIVALSLARLIQNSGDAFTARAFHQEMRALANDFPELLPAYRVTEPLVGMVFDPFGSERALADRVYVERGGRCVHPAGKAA